MSPQSLRRFRAERLLRREFDALRPKVLSTVRSRLGGGACELDTGDLEACYAQAWQGLYAVVLDGEEIANPAGWLVVVTSRRAIDERRARREALRAPEPEALEHGWEPDMEARIDDMRTLRSLFAGLRGGLGRRELEAATLCYLQGFSRAEAAARMGVSARRLDKLMEGNPRTGGVATKVGELVGVIRAEAWCEEQGSTMRALALGILDPHGERYELAVAHQRECPACRRYVRSLRGLAAVLPPPLMSLRIAGGAGTGVGTGAGAAGGLASGSAAGGGAWPLAGPVLAKLAGVGAVLGLAAGGALLAVGGQRSENDGKSGRQAAALHTPADVSGQGAILARSDRAVRSRQTARAINGSRAHASETSARRARRPNSARSRRASTGVEFGIETADSQAGWTSAASSARMGRGARTGHPEDAPFHHAARRGTPPSSPSNEACRVPARVGVPARYSRGKTFASFSSASGFPRTRRRPVKSARLGSSRFPMMSTMSW